MTQNADMYTVYMSCQVISLKKEAEFLFKAIPYFVIIILLDYGLWMGLVLFYQFF